MDKMPVVLLIDDERDYCDLVEMHLAAVSNYEVICAPGGKEGLKLAKRIIPDIIILDIMMPDQDGFAVLEALKKDNRTMAIPVIMLSGLDGDQAKIKASQLYDELYITKPVDVHELKTKIDEILKLRHP